MQDTDCFKYFLTVLFWIFERLVSLLISDDVNKTEKSSFHLDGFCLKLTSCQYENCCWSKNRIATQFTRNLLLLSKFIIIETLTRSCKLKKKANTPSYLLNRVIPLIRQSRHLKPTRNLKISLFDVLEEVNSIQIMQATIDR